MAGVVYRPALERVTAPARRVDERRRLARSHVDCRTAGAAKRGQRDVDAVPYGPWQTSAVLPGLARDQVIAPCVFDRAIDGTLVLAYLEPMLVPIRTPGDTAVTDNLGSHTTDVRQPVEAAGATVPLLPVSSPTSTRSNRSSSS